MTLDGAITYVGSALLAVQLALFCTLLTRLAPGRRRRPPIDPIVSPRDDTSVSIVIATLNEAHRLAPCLDGVLQQRSPVREILVVDSASTDGTRDLVRAAMRRDSRVRLIDDGTLPDGWVGKVWALENGLRASTGEWVLGIDADTIPAPGLVGGILAATEDAGLDVASFAPRFEAQGPGERWVQPAMLVTLVYRCGAAGSVADADRVLANGQCFLARRSTLVAAGGYSSARASFSDDVSLARHLAAAGARVGFLDGSRVISVRSYASLGDMWREWGRSFDLKDATARWQQWLDVALVWSTQALPLPLLAIALSWLAVNDETSRTHDVEYLVRALTLVNVSALSVRLLMLLALRHCYAVRGASYWLSWLADVPAAWRLTLSTLRTPTAWRGRRYDAFASAAR